jgi:hypothetical protein
VQVGVNGQPGPVLEGTVSVSDVPGLQGVGFACFRHVTGTLSYLEPDSRVSLSLGERGYELFTLVPVENGFAPIGLVDKLNSAASLSGVSFPNAQRCELELRDGGDFLAHCEQQPARVSVAGRPAVFSYERESRSLRFSSAASGRHTISIDW